MESKYNSFLTILLIAIIVGIIGLLGILGYDFFKNKNDDQDAKEYVEAFANTNENTQSNNESLDNMIEVNGITGTSTSGKRKYKGFNVLGTIEIPKTNVSYPILEKPTRKALEVAVVKIYPKSNDVINKKGNVVIAGHNYRNGRFFSNNKNLSNGDKIYITDLDGKKVTYVVYKKFETSSEDTSCYNRDTNGAMEITLSTCTDDNSKRTIILAKAE